VTSAADLTQHIVQQVPIKALAQALIDRADELGLTWQLRPAQVTTPAADGALQIIYDGDTAVQRATSMLGALPVGLRVYCLITPPAGNHVVGVVGGPTYPAIGQSVAAVRTSDVNLVNNTFVDDTVLKFAVTTGTYMFEMESFYNALAAAGFKSQFTLTAGTIGLCSFIDITPNYLLTNANGLVIGIAGNSTDRPFTTRGSFTATGPGFFTWQRAQNTTNGTPTVVRAGTKMWMRRTA